MTFHDRIPLYVSSFAAVLVALSFVIGVSVGLGALAGALVAVANVLALRWLVTALASSGESSSRGSSRGAASVLLMFKMAGVLAVAAILIFVVRVDPVGFAIGFGAPILGLTVGAAHTRFSALSSDEASAAVTKGE